MKKTLIALAALSAIAGAAQAQSSVTLYGVVDAYFGQKTTINAPAGLLSAGAASDLTQTVVGGSGLSSSRWGMKGAEDLGGGLKAVFTLEGGFNIDTGGLANNGGSTVANSTTILFGRTASVGVTGNFGAVTLGRQYSAFDDFYSPVNNTYDSNTFATTHALSNAVGLVEYSNRVNNSIKYVSPVIGGFSGAIVYGLGEDKTTATAASKSTSLHVKYANGPLLVGYAYQRENDAAAAGALFTNFTGVPAVSAATTVAVVRSYNLIGASYDFGVAKVVGSYNKAKNDAATERKDTDYQFGVSVPFGAAAVALGYAKSKSESADVTRNGSGYSLVGTYDLSKRTTAYAGYYALKADQDANAAANSEYQSKVFGLGVRHSF
jgi:predicted porin